MTARPIIIDPDTGIPDLIRRLADDSKRLVTNEVQLAKLEGKDSLHRGVKGMVWLAVAFGVAVVMLVALTVFLSTLIGRLASGHMWVGAVITGLVELALGAWLVKKSFSVFAKPSYTLEQTRHSLDDTRNWVTPPRT